MSNQKITVTLQCYGELQRWCGASQQVEFSKEQATAQAAIDQLLLAFPQAESVLKRSACALGDRLVPTHEKLHNGATLALIPPVSGG